MRSWQGRLAIVAVLSAFSTASHAQNSSPDLGGFSLSREIDQRLNTIRDRSDDLFAAVANIPEATGRAAAMLVADERTTPRGLVTRLSLLWLGGWFAERLFWRWSAVWMRRIADSPLATPRQRATAQAQRLLFAQSLVVCFAAGSCLSYLVAAPPGAAGVMAFNALLAIVAVRSARVVGRFLLAPGGARLRLVALSTVAAWRGVRNGAQQP